MITTTLKFRVRYNEVDRMGYVHHGNYAAYFEMGRTELMREYGITYKNLEDDGIILPLSEYYVKFYDPALYDDELILKTSLLPIQGVRIIFEYRLLKNDDTLVAEGRTPLVFVNSTTRKPIRPPSTIVDKITAHF
jgi:acyl-CoA thioester hydrolase